jgi:hypothetical protein
VLGLERKSHVRTLLIYILLLITLLILISSLIYNLSKNPIKSLFYAVITAVIMSFILMYIQRRFKSKTKMEENTILVKPQRLFAKLVLPNETVMMIKSYGQVLGRENFLGFVPPEKLLFIGKSQFKLSKFDDGFYIEDLQSKNGTKVNGCEIRGLGKIKLKNGDEICVSKVLKLQYLENS